MYEIPDGHVHSFEHDHEGGHKGHCTHPDQPVPRHGDEFHTHDTQFSYVSDGDLEELVDGILS